MKPGEKKAATWHSVFRSEREQKALDENVEMIKAELQAAGYNRTSFGAGAPDHRVSLAEAEAELVEHGRIAQLASEYTVSETITPELQLTGRLPPQGPDAATVDLIRSELVDTRRVIAEETGGRADDNKQQPDQFAAWMKARAEAGAAVAKRLLK